MVDNKVEIWKPVKEYEGLYEVSNLGNVKAIERRIRCRNQFCEYYRTYPSKVLYKGPINGKDGYLQVSLSNQGKWKCKLVHRLVAEAFIPNPDNLPEVNHKDRNKQNNCVDNLEWSSKLDNMKHAKEHGWDPTQSRKGRHNSEEHKLAVSKAMKYHLYENGLIEKLQHIHRKNDRCCRCIETSECFMTFNQAGRRYNINMGDAGYAVKHGHAIHGYHFELITYEDYLDYIKIHPEIAEI